MPPTTATTATSATTARTRSLRLAAACLTAAAALTLTACGPDSASGVRTSGDTATPSTGEQRAAGQPTGGGGTAKAPAGGGTKGASRTGHATGGTNAAAGSTAGKPGGRTPTCTPANVTVRLQPVKRPINHLVVTATNTSKTACTAYAYPYVTFDGDKAGLDAVAESKPKAVITIAPGRSAYAGIRLSSADGSGRNGRTARQVAIAFAEVDAAGDPGRPVNRPAPGGSVHVDDGGAVTYWRGSAEDALTW